MADLVTFHPPAEFRLRSDIAGKTIDPAIKAVIFHGQSSLGRGGGRYTRVTGSVPAGLVGNQGVVDLGDGTYLQLDADQTVRVTHHGAILNNVADDGPAVRSAHTYCATVRSPYYVPLRFPVGQANVLSGSSIPMVNGMHWAGEGNYNTEASFLSAVRFNLAHLFGFGGVDKDWVTLTGILFDGKTQAFSLFEPFVSTPVLFHSTFAYGGFKNFNQVFGAPISGCKIEDIYFQNNRSQFRTAGADNIIRDNYLSGSGWAAGGNSDTGPNPPAGPTTWGVEFGIMVLTRFVRNYMTGSPQMFMRCTARLHGTMITENWFDICDLSGLSFEGASCAIVTNNSFNRNMIGLDATKVESNGTTNATYNAIVRIIASTDIMMSTNFFGFLTNGGGVPSPVPTTLNVTGASQNIQLRDSIYLSPYVRSVAFDATAHPPRIDEMPGLDVLAMVNADLTFRPMQADIVYANTALSAARSLTLSKTGAVKNDRVRVTRGAAATGAFNINIINGAAGPTLKSLTAISQWADFHYDGTNWIGTAFGAL